VKHSSLIMLTHSVRWPVWPSAAQVQDLGVVGGGRRVAPVPAAAPAAAAASGGSGDAAAAASAALAAVAACVPAVPVAAPAGGGQKRSLESLLGGAEAGGAAVGFGGSSNSPNLPAPAGQAASAPDAKRVRQEPAPIEADMAENQQ
jgi:hypothetical protein